jgi:hypothetical protein
VAIRVVHAALEVRVEYTQGLFLLGLDSSFDRLTFLEANSPRHLCSAPGAFLVAKTIDVLLAPSTGPGFFSNTKNLVKFASSLWMSSFRILRLYTPAALLLAIAAKSVRPDSATILALPAVSYEAMVLQSG